MGEARAEKLINCFHVDTQHSEKFLLFRDETLLITNEHDQLDFSPPVSYQEIDEEIIQLRVVKEDYGCIGETFLCAFQVLHSSKIKTTMPIDTLRSAFITMKLKQGSTAAEAQLEFDKTSTNPESLQSIVLQLNDKV